MSLYSNRFIINCILAVLLVIALPSQAQRKDVLLENGWYSIANDSSNTAFDGFERKGYITGKGWEAVSVPHTWDKYGGYRQLKHGNRHGYAWYRKTIRIDNSYRGKQLFLWFEGVSSFATVWVNGVKVGEHAGGRTSFTLDITKAAVLGAENIIAVRADHPAFIRTLPWVCGGCSEEQGFSEGSQPMGIFRPVHLIATAPVRIAPFGVYIWNDTSVINQEAALLHIETELSNYALQSRKVTLEVGIEDSARNRLFTTRQECVLQPGKTDTVIVTGKISKTVLWSTDRPYRYRIVTRILEKGQVADELQTRYGVRYVQWRTDAEGQTHLLLNGVPVFLNGTAEYEQLLGNSHAFTATEIYARAMQVKAAGFNAFRDAHQPHNLRYQEYWDSLGILWWPQFAAHIWFDIPEFRSTFKSLLRDWIKERRNSPSIILWGLENESTLPEDFARECSDIIREMDKGASVQRKITTCNGGTGTDWNVPQNWTGTYGGDPATYGSDLIKQGLVGEYGAWRSIDWHSEGVYTVKGDLTEDRMTQLMEMKVRLADSVKDKTAGHFHWLLYSHDNPGRVQPDEGYRYIDKVGPVNNKGLFTIWGEPADAFYMYRSNFTSPVTNPMVYIVSHTWPERWLTPGIKSGIIVYSNCEEVELFNDAGHHVSLGKRRRGGVGTHFKWDSVPVLYNVLYAQGYVNGKPVAEDVIKLLHLPDAPHAGLLHVDERNITAAAEGWKYRFRLNCGGPEYTDINGHEWNGDGMISANTYSWADSFPGMNPAQASQRKSFDVIKNTSDQELFQTYRYGREDLKYSFSVEKGDYLIELYFTEPWYGTGGGMDCTGWRVFDVAVNEKTVIKNLDIWKEAGVNRVLKKTVLFHVTGDTGITIHFPHIQSSQAVIAGIAIAAKTPRISLLKHEGRWRHKNWLNKGDKVYQDTSVRFHYLPALFYGDRWLQPSVNAAEHIDDYDIDMILSHTEVYIAMDSRVQQLPDWMKGFEPVPDSIVTDATGSGSVFRLYKYRISSGTDFKLGENGISAMGKAGMYLVIIHQPTAYENAEKVKRPVITYTAQQAIRSGSGYDTTVTGYSGTGYMQLKQQTDTAIWKFTVGVGDTYELRLRYRTVHDIQVPVWMTVRSADGTLMRHDKLFFAPATGKWKTLFSSTGTNINAGTYTVELVPAGAEGLLLDRLEVQ